MAFVESRTFDTRLTKSALLRDFQPSAITTQRADYRQFKTNYPKESFSSQSFLDAHILFTYFHSINSNNLYNSNIQNSLARS